MKRPTKIDGWDVPDSIQVPDGYNMTSIPDLTRNNFNYLIDEYNNLVDVVNILVCLTEDKSRPQNIMGFENGGE